MNCEITFIVLTKYSYNYLPSFCISPKGSLQPMSRLNNYSLLGFEVVLGDERQFIVIYLRCTTFFERYYIFRRGPYERYHLSYGFVSGNFLRC